MSKNSVVSVNFVVKNALKLVLSVNQARKSKLTRGAGNSSLSNWQIFQLRDQTFDHIKSTLPKFCTADIYSCFL